MSEETRTYRLVWWQSPITARGSVIFAHFTETPALVNPRRGVLDMGCHPQNLKEWALPALPFQLQIWEVNLISLSLQNYKMSSSTYAQQDYQEESRQHIECD